MKVPPARLLAAALFSMLVAVVVFWESVSTAVVVRVQGATPTLSASPPPSSLPSPPPTLPPLPPAALPVLAASPPPTRPPIVAPAPVLPAMPACIFLNPVIGGLGNHVFPVLTVVARARTLGMGYVLPLSQQEWRGGNIVSPTYWSGVFESLVPDSRAEATCLPIVERERELGGVQFEELGPIDPSAGSVRVHSMMMSYRDILVQKDFLRSKLRHAQTDEFAQRYPGRMLVVGYRPFLQEGHPEWGSTLKYYEAAISLVLRPDHASVQVFGEDIGNEDFFSWVKARVAPVPAYYWPGKRDMEKSTMHFRWMLAGNDFVLCVSSFHLWGAVFGDLMPDSKVTIDVATGNWHLKCPGLPESWIKLDIA